MSQGKEPHLFSTQFHIFDDGRTLIHDGPEGGPQVRAIIGGMGISGASGEVFAAARHEQHRAIQYPFHHRKEIHPVIRTWHHSHKIRVAGPSALPLTGEHLLLVRT